MAVSTRAVDTFGLSFLGSFAGSELGAEPVGDGSPGGSGEVKVVELLFLQSEGLTKLLAVGNDAPNGLQSLIFGRGHGEYFAELS
jgi:hypothetical protein